MFLQAEKFLQVRVKSSQLVLPLFSYTSRPQSEFTMLFSIICQIVTHVLREAMLGQRTLELVRVTSYDSLTSTKGMLSKSPEGLAIQD